MKNITEQIVLKRLDKKLKESYESWGFERMQPTKNFIFERSVQWSKVLSIPYFEIINKWLEDCNYSMINYFQDCNQPILNENTRIFETKQDFIDSVGKLGYRCPCCGGISTSPYKCNSGLSKYGKICDWCSYGVLGTLGKGVFVFIKENFGYATIFNPISWED